MRPRWTPGWETVHLRAEIRGEQAAFYLNHAPEPVLRVDRLLHGADAKGGEGLFVEIGTEGLFRSLTIWPRTEKGDAAWQATRKRR